MFEKIALYINGINKKAEFDFPFKSGEASFIAAIDNQGTKQIVLKFSYCGNYHLYPIYEDEVSSFKKSLEEAIEYLDNFENKN